MRITVSFLMIDEQLPTLFVTQRMSRFSRGYTMSVYLEVVWQFGSSGVSRVHGDTDVAGRVQTQLGALKHERLHPALTT